MDEEQRWASMHRDPVHKTTLPVSQIGCPPSGSATEAALVSVVIPTYNRAEMLARAIQSALRQTYTNLEIIIVDDASHDGTREVVGSFTDSRIRYLRHDSNRGGSAARNTGIRAATGQFIAFLDDDDEWLPRKTEEQLCVLREFEAVACTSTQRDGEGVRRELQSSMLTLDDLRLGPWGGTGVLMAHAGVVKATMFDESLPMGQDWDFFIRLALKSRIAYLDKPLLRYNGGDHPRITNARRKLSLRQLEQQLRVVHKHQQLFGARWFRRQMCNGLLYGIKYRSDKLALLTYAARRYGTMNVVRTLTARVRAKWFKGKRRWTRHLSGVSEAQA